MRLIRFGTYTFPAQTEFSTNFGDVVMQTSRLPGRDGGYDYCADAPAPKEVGNVRVGFWLTADSPAELRAKVDACYGMIETGLARLYIDPQNGDGYRYCEAKVNNIRIAEGVRDLPHKRQKVDLNFQVAGEPFWISTGTEAPTYGGGFSYGGGSSYGGDTTPTALSGLQTDVTVTNGGSAHTSPRFTLDVGAGQTCEDFTIQRLVGGTVVEQVKYTGVIAGAHRLEVNCRALSVTLDSTAAYANLTFTRGHWVKLVPGSNTLRFKFKNVGDAASVKIRYVTRYA